MHNADYAIPSTSVHFSYENVHNMSTTCSPLIEIFLTAKVASTESGEHALAPVFRSGGQGIHRFTALQ